MGGRTTAVPDRGGRPLASIPLLDELARKAIIDALQRTHGHKARAAELLGLSRFQLYNRLNRCHIEVSPEWLGMRTAPRPILPHSPVHQRTPTCASARRCAQLDLGSSPSRLSIHLSGIFPAAMIGTLDAVSDVVYVGGLGDE